MDKKYAIRVDIRSNGAVYLSGGIKHKPAFTWFNSLPNLLADKIAILSMLNNYERMPEFGKKINSNLYYVRLTLDDWDVLVMNGQCLDVNFKKEELV